MQRNGGDDKWLYRAPLLIKKAKNRKNSVFTKQHYTTPRDELLRKTDKTPVITRTPPNIAQSFLVGETQKQGYFFMLQKVHLENKRSIYDHMFNDYESNDVENTSMFEQRMQKRKESNVVEEIIVNHDHFRKLHNKYLECAELSAYLLQLLKAEIKEESIKSPIQSLVNKMMINDQVNEIVRGLDSARSISSVDSSTEVGEDIKEYDKVWYDPSGNWLREVAVIKVEKNEKFMNEMNDYEKKLKFFLMEREKMKDVNEKADIFKEIQEMDVKLQEQEREYFENIHAEQKHNMEEFVQKELNRFKEKRVLSEMEKIKFRRIEREKRRKLRLAKITARKLRRYLFFSKVERAQKALNLSKKRRVFGEWMKLAQATKHYRTSLMRKAFSQGLKSNVTHMYLMKKKLRMILTNVLTKTMVRLTFTHWRNFSVYKKVQCSKKLSLKKYLFNPTSIQPNLNGLYEGGVVKLGKLRSKSKSFATFISRKQEIFFKNERSEMYYNSKVKLKCFHVLKLYCQRKIRTRKMVKDHIKYREVSLKKKVFHELFQFMVHSKFNERPNRDLKRKYFHLWLRQNYFDKLEKEFLETHLPKIKLVCYFWMWKKKFLRRKIKETSFMTKILLNQPKAIWALSLIQNDKIQFIISDKYLKLRKFYLGRKFFKTYIAIMHRKNEIDLKRMVFNKLRDYAQFKDVPDDETVNEESLSSSPTSRKMGKGVLDESSKNIVRSFFAIRSKFIEDYDNKNVLVNRLSFRNPENQKMVKKYYEKFMTYCTPKDKRLVFRNILTVMSEYKRQRKIKKKLVALRRKFEGNQITRKNIEEIEKKEAELFLVIKKKKDSFKRTDDEVKSIFQIFATQGDENIFNFVARRVKRNYEIMRVKIPRDRETTKQYCKKNNMIFDDGANYEETMKKAEGLSLMRRRKLIEEEEEKVQEKLKSRFKRNFVLKFAHEGMLDTLKKNRMFQYQRQGGPQRDNNERNNSMEIFDIVMGKKKKLFEFFRTKQENLKTGKKKEIVIHKRRTRRNRSSSDLKKMKKMGKSTSTGDLRKHRSSQNLHKKRISDSVVASKRKEFGTLKKGMSMSVLKIERSKVKSKTVTRWSPKREMKRGSSTLAILQKNIKKVRSLSPLSPEKEKHFREIPSRKVSKDGTKEDSHLKKSKSSNLKKSKSSFSKSQSSLSRWKSGKTDPLRVKVKRKIPKKKVKKKMTRTIRKSKSQGISGLRKIDEVEENGEREDLNNNIIRLDVKPRLIRHRLEVGNEKLDQQRIEDTKDTNLVEKKEVVLNKFEPFMAPWKRSEKENEKVNREKEEKLKSKEPKKDNKTVQIISPQSLPKKELGNKEKDYHEGEKKAIWIDNTQFATEEERAKELGDIPKERVVKIHKIKSSNSKPKNEKEPLNTFSPKKGVKKVSFKRIGEGGKTIKMQKNEDRGEEESRGYEQDMMFKFLEQNIRREILTLSKQLQVGEDIINSLAKEMTERFMNKRILDQLGNIQRKKKVEKVKKVNEKRRKVQNEQRTDFVDINKIPLPQPTKKLPKIRKKFISPHLSLYEKFEIQKHLKHSLVRMHQRKRHELVNKEVMKQRILESRKRQMILQLNQEVRRKNAIVSTRRSYRPVGVPKISAFEKIVKTKLKFKDRKNYLLHHRLDHLRGIVFPVVQKSKVRATGESGNKFMTKQEEKSRRRNLPSLSKRKRTISSSGGKRAKSPLKRGDSHRIIAHVNKIKVELDNEDFNFYLLNQNEIMKKLWKYKDYSKIVKKSLNIVLMNKFSFNKGEWAELVQICNEYLGRLKRICNELEHYYQKKMKRDSEGREEIIKSLMKKKIEGSKMVL